MEPSTARFVRRENVKHYRQLLETVTDEIERQKNLKLLANEVKKQTTAGDPVEETDPPQSVVRFRLKPDHSMSASET